MPKKKDKLEGGITSKVYFAAFPEYINIYQISLLIYGNNKSVGTISKSVKKLKKELEISKVMAGRREKFVLSKAEPIITFFEKRGLKLTEEERKFLLDFLNSKEFRNLIGLRIKNFDFKKDFSAMVHIIIPATYLFEICHATKIYNLNEKQLDKIIERIDSQTGVLRYIMEKAPDLICKKIIDLSPIHSPCIEIIGIMANKK